ncbi:purine-nucleoside phosphorylase [Thermodesulfobacteriota bacterium]
MEEKIREAAQYLSSKIDISPEIGMVLGTGLGNLTEKMEVCSRIPYQQIPHFPLSTVEGHKGTLLVGRSSGRPLLALEGRFHIYEGYSLDEITFPIRLMSSLGIKYLFISSAVGGLNPLFATGDVMLVTDHINLTGRNPLIGPNLDFFGPRFPDMTHVYNRDLLSLAKRKALEAGIPLREGVYVGITGPSLETPAETRFLRMIGADAVGMSTVSEVIVGKHCDLKVIAIVAITNVNLPDCMEQTTIEEVIAAANKSGKILSVLWEQIISSLPE